jgi:hypothetical protein
MCFFWRFALALASELESESEDESGSELEAPSLAQNWGELLLILREYATPSRPFSNLIGYGDMSFNSRVAARGDEKRLIVWGFKTHSVPRRIYEPTFFYQVRKFYASEKI